MYSKLYTTVEKAKEALGELNTRALVMWAPAQTGTIRVVARAVQHTITHEYCVYGMNDQLPG